MANALGHLCSLGNGRVYQCCPPSHFFHLQSWRCGAGRGERELQWKVVGLMGGKGPTARLGWGLTLKAREVSASFGGPVLRPGRQGAEPWAQWKPARGDRSPQLCPGWW